MQGDCYWTCCGSIHEANELENQRIFRDVGTFLNWGAGGKGVILLSNEVKRRTSSVTN